MNNHSKTLTFTAQIAKKSALRRVASSSLMLLGLTGAAYAQAGTDQMLKDKDAADGKAAKEFINRMQTDEQYQKTIREQPSASTSSDPWGTVRPNAPSPAAKPAAKSAAGTAKTASGSKPAGGAVKPAAGAAASAGGSIQKGQ